MSSSNILRTLPEDSKPVFIPQKLEVPRRSTATSTPTAPESNHALHSVNGTGIKRKRSISQGDEIRSQSKKPTKACVTATDGNSIFLDGSENGTFVIEDD